MNAKLEKWVVYFYFFMVFAMLWQNIAFFFNHMSDDYSNLGIALSGVPFTLVFFCLAIQLLFRENRRAIGIVYVIGMPLIFLLELIIYFLQDYPLMFGFIISLLFYLAFFIMGCVIIRKASKK